MMRSLLAAAGLVILVNAFALVHVARNRLGAPTGEVTLTDRELTSSPREDDSGVRLTFHWASGQSAYSRRPWLSGARLGFTPDQIAALGFDLSMPLEAPTAERFYTRQSARAGFVAFQIESQAEHTARLALEEDTSSEPAARNQGRLPQRPPDFSSYLVAVDADRNAAALRARWAGKSQVFVLPAVIALGYRPEKKAREGIEAAPANVWAHIREIPADIHVPRPFSDAFHRYQTLEKPDRAGELFRVRLRFGALGEPWVTAVEFPFEANPR